MSQGSCARGVCHVDEILKVMDDEQKARARDDRPPDLGEMSLAESASP